MENIKFIVDGKNVTIPKGGTILQGCEVAGVSVPRFCYHERLSVAGNCRMCLVEVEKSPKLVASCAMAASNGIVVHTNSPAVRKAREGVLELLLINHPLDCPICDQGGECDLQDQAMQFGSDRSRYTEYKRAVADKDLGPIVKTVMTRCIACTRCIRFATEIAGIETLGTTGRGNVLEIGTYIEKLLNTELSGNVIDICPVGALTNKPYAFKTRSWELKSTESIDILDPLCSNIRIDSRGAEVFRILPKLNDDINQCWISDKTRFAFEGWSRQRLLTPTINGISNRTWEDIINSITNILTSNQVTKTVSKGKDSKKSPKQQVSIYLGSLMDMETSILLHRLTSKLGIPLSFISPSKKSQVNADLREFFILGSNSYTTIEKADTIINIASNPRLQSPVFNTNIRRAYQHGTQIYNLTTSSKSNLSYSSKTLGITSNSLLNLIQGKHILTQTILKSKSPYIMDSGLSSSSILPLYSVLHTINTASKEKPKTSQQLIKYKVKSRTKLGKNLNKLHFGHFAESVGSISMAEVGLNTQSLFANTHYNKPINNKAGVNIVLSGSHCSQERAIDPIVKKSSSILVGHHIESSINPTVIAPTNVESEKVASYINILGHLQKTQKALTQNLTSNTKITASKRDSWQIIAGILAKISNNKTYFPIDVQNWLYNRSSTISNSNPTAIGILDQTNTKIINTVLSTILPIKSYRKVKHNTHVTAIGYIENHRVLLDAPIQNYFQNDPISNASPVLAQCSSMQEKEVLFTDQGLL